jgi:hypothetical protein
VKESILDFLIESKFFSNITLEGVIIPNVGEAILSMDERASISWLAVSVPSLLIIAIVAFISNLPPSCYFSF